MPPHSPNQLGYAASTRSRHARGCLWAILAFFPCSALDGAAGGEALRQLGRALSHGEAEISTLGYFRENERDSDRYAAALRITQEASVDLSAKTRLYAELEYALDTRPYVAGVVDDWAETQERRYYLNARELYVKVAFAKADLYVGKRVYAWGKAEAYNPVERLNAYDFLDFLEARKIGAPSAAFEWFGDRSSVELALIPAFTPARLPGEGNRWFLFPNLDSPPLAGPPAVNARETPARTWDNAQWAGRFQTTLGGLDLGFSYYHGFDAVPVGEIAPNPTAFDVTPVYNPIDEYGAVFAFTRGRAAFHGEAAYRVSERGYDDDFLTYAIGVVYAWTGGQSLDNARLTVEWVDEAFVDEAPQGARFATRFNRPFRGTLFSELELAFLDDSAFAFKLAYNVDDRDYYVQSLWRRRFHDSLELEAGADILDGEPDTLWGAWDRNDRWFARLHWRF